MFRNILVSIFFFVGPALLMFLARNLTVMGMIWLKNRQRRARQQQVIDITPIHKHSHPNWYVIIVVIVSLTCAVTVFLELQKKDEVVPQEYVPAYTDETGSIVPGHWRPKAPETDQ
ncbi:hypothetical protein Ga0123462_0971 [Mariprofundus ferrinatatus]|uniref:Uncharacterized protein n=1 Tax=Mariprofundus ferrinatatus TaxID=1921087 RepID=A0A2K8L3D0_9PROT|nr:hypothetical protein [Mariprofundus ferrinatatus]ATX81840.1 hypothetical protein Ga0123462_0971 [Mariprofundus ferrinatatus]